MKIPLSKEQKVYLAGLDKSKHRKAQKQQFKLQNKFDHASELANHTFSLMNDIFESFDEKYPIDTFMTCTVKLDRKSILQMLQNNEVVINGETYEVPEQKLILCLFNSEYGNTKLEFKLKK